MKVKKGKWVGLTIHHTAGSVKDTVASIKKYHTEVNGWGDIAYNYVLEIKKDRGMLKKGRDTKWVGAHAGVDYYNENYLSLVIPGNYMTGYVTGELYQDLLGAICTIVKKFNLTHLNGHREFKATDCPGSHIDMKKLREDVNAKLKASGYNVTLVK